MSKHTRGPWTIHPKWGQPAVGVDVGDGGPLLPIAEVVGGQNKTAAKANARLIAAAPDLLAALRNLVSSLDTGGDNPWHDESPTPRNGRLDVDAGSAAMEHNEVLRAEIAAARAAIAKAEGGGA